MTPSEFHAALWGDPPPGMVGIFVLPERDSYWYEEFSNIDRDLERHHHEEVYTGVALAAKEGGRFTRNNRVKEADAAALAGLWADIDVLHKVHKKKTLPETAEQAFGVMGQLPYEASFIVDSGHGLQFWWLFNKPWVFADKAEWAQARRVTQWWHGLIEGLFGARGWIIDSVFDLSRIMRVPGTYNNKVPGERKRVAVVKDDGPRYVINDFLDLVPPDFVASSPVDEKAASGGSRNGQKGRESKGTTTARTGLVLRADAQPSPVRLEALLKTDTKFRLTWERNRSDLLDQSASSYNMSIANRCVRAGWPDQEVVHAMIYWRTLHGEDLKLRERYYERTLAKAKQSVEETSTRRTLDSTAKASHREESIGASVSYLEEKREKVILMRDEGLNIEACVRAIKLSNNPPTIFSISDGQSIGVITSTEGSIGMAVCTAEQTHLEIARRVRFVNVNKKGIELSAVPTVTLMNLVHRALRTELPRFRGFKWMPFLWGGSLVTSPGYHSESGHYVDVPVDLDLTLSVESAIKVIEDYFGEFPYQGPADRANAYSVVLGFPLKALGNGPGLFVDKPSSQTGASLLCQCLAWVIEGRPPHLITQGKSIGELDKRLITKLKLQPTAIIFDNLNRELDSDMVASGMTDESFGGRLLSLNVDALVPTRSIVLMFTGKNLTATRELQNRCLRCRLDADHPNPETRKNFRHILPEAVATNRHVIVSAVSSIVQRWIDAGIPEGDPVLGSFIPYTKALSGLMAFAGMPHLDENRRAMLSESTPSWESLDDLIMRWWEKYGGNPVPSIDLVELAEELDLKGETERSRATSLSRRLGHALGQVFEVADGVLVKLLESGRNEKRRAKQGLRYRLIQL